MPPGAQIESELQNSSLSKLNSSQIGQASLGKVRRLIKLFTQCTGAQGRLPREFGET